MKRLNRKKVLFLCILFVVMAGVLVWYDLPIKRTATAELYCDDPKVSGLSAELDLCISRSLFSPSAIHGTIHIGDRDYVVWGRQEYDFASNIQRKIKGEIDIPVFINADNFGKGTDLLLRDLLYIHSIQFGDDYKIENVSLSMNSDDYGVWNSRAVIS